MVEDGMFRFTRARRFDADVGVHSYGKRCEALHVFRGCSQRMIETLLSRGEVICGGAGQLWGLVLVQTVYDFFMVSWLLMAAKIKIEGVHINEIKRNYGSCAKAAAAM